MAAPAACDALPPPVSPPPLPLGVTIPVATRSFDLLSPPTSNTVAPDATIPISQLDSAAEASACFGGFDGAEATIVEPPVQFVSSNVETSVAMLDAVNVDGAEATTVEPPVPFASSTVETSGASPGVAKGLEMGSNDPHVLRLHDDRAPAVRRRPTYPVAAHMPECSERLEERALPCFNPPPATAKVDPPPPSPPSPPVVTSIEQVVPKATLAKVRTWLRRLRRCLRAAKAGKVSLAKRLRPDDLWLSHEANSQPATRQWNWDLRALMHGLPATPLQVSGRDGVLPHTDLVLSAIGGVDDAAFADQAIICEMLHGVGDDAECERGTLLCAPHTSALERFEVTSEKLQVNLDKGWASGPHDLPCWPLRTYPYGVVDESERAGRPKFRLTSDLSWPHDGMMDDGSGGFVQAVNASMRRSLWPENKLLRVSEVAEAAAVLQSSGAPVQLWGIYCKAYYRVHGRQISELWRNAVATLEGIQVDERCCFGSAADATKCSRVSNYLAWRVRRAIRAVDAQYPCRLACVLEWQQRRATAGRAAGASEAEIDELWTALSAFGFYIDDGAAASISDELYDRQFNPLMRDGVHVRRAQLHFEAACAALREVGHTSELSKEQPPSLRLQTLGVEIDLQAGRMRLLDSKRVRYAERVRRLLVGTICTRHELVSLLGRLSFAAGCYPVGRQWLNAAWRSARARYRLDGDRVALTPPVRAGLERWAAELESGAHEGVPLASRRMRGMGAPGVGAIYADASGAGGYMAWTVAAGELLYVVGEWEPNEMAMPIHGKELLASTLGLVALQPECGFSDVYSFTDNIVAQYAMRNSKAEGRAMQRLVERRSGWLLQSGVLEAAERITSKANLWADLGSRGCIADVLDQAAALGLSSRQIFPELGWRFFYGDCSEWMDGD